jgi:hypothetical protein
MARVTILKFIFDYSSEIQANAKSKQSKERIGMVYEANDQKPWPPSHSFHFQSFKILHWLDSRITSCMDDKLDQVVANSKKTQQIGHVKSIISNPNIPVSERNRVLLQYEEHNIYATYRSHFFAAHRLSPMLFSLAAIAAIRAFTVEKGKVASLGVLSILGGEWVQHFLALEKYTSLAIKFQLLLRRTEKGEELTFETVAPLHQEKIEADEQFYVSPSAYRLSRFMMGKSRRPLEEFDLYPSLCRRTGTDYWKGMEDPSINKKSLSTL